MPEEFDKIEQVGRVEGPVFESQKFSDLPLGVVQYELVRGVIHEAHQLPGFSDDRRSVTPGENGGKESGDLDVLFFFVRMRYADRVIRDK